MDDISLGPPSPDWGAQSQSVNMPSVVGSVASVTGGSIATTLVVTPVTMQSLRSAIQDDTPTSNAQASAWNRLHLFIDDVSGSF